MWCKCRLQARRDSGVGSGTSSVGLDVTKFQFLLSRRERDSSLPANLPGSASSTPSISRTDSAPVSGAEASERAPIWRASGD